MIVQVVLGDKTGSSRRDYILYTKMEMPCKRLSLDTSLEFATTEQGEHAALACDKQK